MIKKREKDEGCCLANIKLLHMMRFFLVTAPPVLTMDAKLGILRMKNSIGEDFIYNDLNEYLGKGF